MEKMLGVMIDCSRNAVMKVEVVKKFAKTIREMGYNTLMLYTEDTYEVNNQPFFGHLRGKYTKKELKEIDAYCAGIGIELIPCIQTLAHLEFMFKWGDEYSDINDCDDILLVGEEKTYLLIEDMISTIAECFSSRKIHIGMDEAHNVGMGKYRDIHGNEERFDIINNHLHRVCEITKKYGFKPMIWSDMFCKLAMNITDYYQEGDISKIKEKAQLPEDIELVYWDYYKTDVEQYKKLINANKTFGKKVCFAGGAWTWKGFAPDNDFSMRATKAALEACKDCGVDDVFFTVWGDDGAECSKFAILPALMYAAESIRGNNDIDSIKAKFKDITGCDFDSFVLLDGLDKPVGEHNHGPSKYMFYNDLFMGINDYRCTKEDAEYYKDLTEKLGNTYLGEYEYLLECSKAMAEVLAIKADLGVRTRKAYLDKNTDEIKVIIKDYELLIERIENFFEKFQTQWFLENKPHGFDVQDMRIGGLLQRIKSCKKRLVQLFNGEITQIPELEEKVLNKNTGVYHWSRMFTPNMVTHKI